MSGPVWSDIKEDLQAKGASRLSGLEGLEALLSRASLGKSELGELLDLSPSLLSDANSKVAQQTLEALNIVISRADAPLHSYANLLVPCVAERLGDSRQPVRTLALHVLVSLFKALKPELILDKLAPFWQHKSWKVKQGLLEVIAEVVNNSGAALLGGARDQNNAVLKQIVRMMEEPDMIVREAAIGCLAEIHRQAPVAVVSTINTSNLRPAQQKEVMSRLGAAPAETMASDLATKRSNSGLNMYVTDVGASSVSGGGGYYLPDMAAPVPSSARISVTGTAGSSAPASEQPSGRPLESRRQSPGSSRPSQAPAAAAKRGGFKDGGGMTADGELPAAVPIQITSERELRSELEEATATLALAPNADWQARMAAMQRVEGLILGGAMEWECFHDGMKALAQALSQQFKERRSTIARQTCHLIGVLARALGPRFEPFALALLPTLFGVLVITIAIMAESADEGVRGVLQHCQTGRLLQAIADGVCKERNPKTRQFCAGYLVQILEDWDVGIWSRQLDAVETAIRAAAQDSLADTRQSGRTAMALYNSTLPERAQAFHKRLDSGLQDKLPLGPTGVKAAKPPATRQSLTAAFAASKRLARQATTPIDGGDADSGILVMVPGVSKPHRRQDPAQAGEPVVGLDAGASRMRPPSRMSTAMPAMGPQPTSSQPATCNPVEATVAPSGELPGRPLTATLGRASRKSLAMPPGRIPGGSVDLTGVLTDGNSVCDPQTQARLAALRKPRMSAVPDLPMRVPAPAAPTPSPAVRLATEPSAAARVPCAQTPEQPLNRPPAVPAVPAPSTSTRIAGTMQPDRGTGSAEAGTGHVTSGGLVPLSRVVTAILGGLRTWNEKVEALSALDAHVRASVQGLTGSPGKASGPDGAAPAAVSLVVEPEKLVQALERVRERLMEALEDPHQKVLSAALVLFTSVVRLYGRVLEGQLDRLLPLLLNKAGENKEQSKTLCAEVLSECGRVYRPDVLVPVLSKCLDAVKIPRGKQTVLDFFRAHMGQWGSINPTQLKHWLVRLAPLLDDRAPELRKRAADVLDALLAATWAREPINYVAYQHNSPDVAPLRRYLATLSAGPMATAASGAVGFAPQWVDATFNVTSQQQQQHMAVTGAPPATTADPRRQLPSAAPALPVPLSSAQQPPSPAVNTASSSGAGGQYRGQPEVGPLGTADVPRWASQGQPQGLAPGAATASVTGRAGPQASSAAPSRGPAPGVSAPPAYAPHPPPGRPGPSVGALPTAAPVACSSNGAGRNDTCGASTSQPAFGRAGGSLRALQVPTEINAQFVFLAQLLDAARVAVAAVSRQDVPPGLSANQLSAAMEALADAAEHCSREAWVRMFPALMVELNAWVQHPATPVRTLAFVLLTQLLTHQPRLFTDNNLESQVKLLLHGCVDPVREVALTAGHALRLLLSLCNERHGMLLMQQLLPCEHDLHRHSRKGVRLVAVLDGIRQLAARLDSQELQLLTFTPHPETGITLLEGLVANLDDPETSVRRSAVVTLADLWYRLGHGVRDVLQVLTSASSSSYNLLCIYYLKLHGVAVGGGGNATEHPLVLQTQEL